MTSTLSPTSHWLISSRIKNKNKNKTKSKNKKRHFETHCLIINRMNNQKNSVLTHQGLWIIFIESSEETTFMRK